MIKKKKHSKNIQRNYTNMVVIHFQNQTHYPAKDYLKDFEAIAQYTLSLFKIKKDVELSVNIVSKNTIQEINRTYRHLDRVTDVISFEFDEGFKEWDGYLVLGDLFICYHRAKQQAKAYQHSVRREICFLFTHGLLHLLKMDHLNENQEQEMIAMQNKIMNHFQIIR